MNQAKSPSTLDEILKRKTPDVPLEVGDVLYIPDNKGKRLTVTVLDRIAGFGASTASGALDLALSADSPAVNLKTNLPAVPEYLPARAGRPGRRL